MRFHIVILLLLLCPAAALAQTTEFTYQGRLLFGGSPANGSHDFEFRLFADPDGNQQVGPLVPLSAVNVNNGVFSVRLNFGDQFPGANRFLELRVKPSAEEIFSVLTPRQAITSSPYAIRSVNAENAETAFSATVAGDAFRLGGLPSYQFVQTSDPRLSDARNPLPNSPNYIRNTTSFQPGTFSILGLGRAGGFRVDANGGSLSLGHAGCFTSGFTGVGFAANLTNCNNYSLLGNGIDTMVNSSAGGSLFFREANLNQMVIAPGGNVGIGTSAPQQKLHVDGNEILSTGLAAGFKFRNRGSTSANDDWVWYSSGNLARFNRSGVGDLFSIQTNGNFGIGTSAPQQRLHVDGNEILSTGSAAGFKFRNRGSTSPNDDWVWYSSGNNARLFRAGVGDLMTIGTNGNVGLGTATTTERLSVSGNANISGNIVAAQVTAPILTTGPFEISEIPSINQTVFSRSSGSIRFEIGNIAPMQITNTARVQIFLPAGGGGGLRQLCLDEFRQVSDCSSSSIRYKSNIGSFNLGMKTIHRLRPVFFNWRNTNRPDFGLVAEEVAEIEPLLVTHNDKGEIEGVKYDRIGVVLINAVKEQQAQIEHHQKQINEQNETIRKQRSEIDSLKKFICAQSPSAEFCGSAKVSKEEMQ